MREAAQPNPGCPGCRERWPVVVTKGAGPTGTWHLVPRPLVKLGAYDRLYRCDGGRPDDDR